MLIGGSSSLYNSAEKYVTWGNPVSAGDGTYTTNNEYSKGDPIKSDISEANISVNQSDGTYLIGPLKISYETGSPEGNIKFVKNLTTTIKDQNNNTIISAKIVDVNGNELSGVPNGEEWYIKMPYTRDITKVNIYFSIKYVSSVTGTKTDYKTMNQKLKYSYDSTAVYYDTYYDHICGKGEEYLGRTTGTWNKTYSCSACNEKNNGETYLGKKIRTEIKVTGYLNKVGNSYDDIQDMRDIYGDVEWATAYSSMSIDIKADDEMEIAGDVWEDTLQGKDSTFNGLLDGNDTLLAGIEVRLYEYNSSTGKSTLAKVKGTNPTLTDEKGHYSFTRVDPTKKYYVVFTYNGMIYTNTYGAGKSEYNTDAWNVSSKGSELVSQRQALNKKFVEIGSYPVSYCVTDAIFGNTNYLETRGDGKYYNEVFAKDIVLEYQQKITEKFAEYLESLKNKYSDKDSSNRIINDTDYRAVMQTIYKEIAGNDKNTMKILQYIWDCRINSYGGYESIQDGKTSNTDELYPYYNKILLKDENGNRMSANQEKNEHGYWYVYNGQLHVNQGLILRDSTVVQLTEDLYKTVVSINGKDETYKYGALDNTILDITSADRSQYTQNINYKDYAYKDEGNLNEVAQYEKEYAKIQVYVTYRIFIKNSSNIPASVKEVVTYFDRKYYSYSDSYKTTGGNDLKGIEATFVDTKNNKEISLTEYNSNSFGMKVNTNSIYGETSEKTGDDIKNLYEDGTDMYISFQNEKEDNIILENGEALAIYLTYRLGENSENYEKFSCTYNNKDNPRGNEAYIILQDLLPNDSAEIKMGTISEINGFQTYYRKSLDATDTQTKYNDKYTYSSSIRPNDVYREAGVLNASGYNIPGNLNPEEIGADKRSETDWDNASTLIIKGDTSSRQIQGSVWETEEVANYFIEDSKYAQYKDNRKVKGITVELIEIKNGTEKLRAITETQEDGSYTFTGYIPGDYVVRFTYGDKADYNTSKQISTYRTFTINGSEMNCAYNGQFYQSTKANPNTDEVQYWYVEDVDTRYSDAYDEVKNRKAVNESLQTYTFADVVSAIKNPTNYQMYAYTSMLELEVEKAKTETSGAQEPGYTISNVDFGLTPRTDAKLETDKKVTHLKLIKQNGVPLFDVDTETIRAQGVPGVQQAQEGSNIIVSLDSELQNGATLEITYTITVTNMSLYDSVTYYKNQAGDDIALGLYRENVKNIVYYENNQIRTHKNNSTGAISIGETTLNNYSSSKEIVTTTSAKHVVDFISNNLNFAKVDYTGRGINEDWDMISLSKDDFVKKYYTQKEDEKNLKPEISNLDSTKVYDCNVIVEANANNPLINKELRPKGLDDNDGTGESVSTDITLSKVITANNDSTDTKSYSNTVKVLEINNTVSKVQDMPEKETEKVIVADPTGLKTLYTIIGLVLVVSIIVGGGIFLIKKFILPRNI